MGGRLRSVLWRSPWRLGFGPSGIGGAGACHALAHEVRRAWFWLIFIGVRLTTFVPYHSVAWTPSALLLSHLRLYNHFTLYNLQSPLLSHSYNSFYSHTTSVDRDVFFGFWCRQAPARYSCATAVQGREALWSPPLWSPPLCCATTLTPVVAAPIF
eukprot:2072376-Pyramimonas_sp.AAC.1